MTLFLTILCSMLLVAWVAMPLLAPNSDAPPSPETERLAAVLAALRDLESGDDTPTQDRTKIRARLEKDRNTLKRKLPSHLRDEALRLCGQCDSLIIGDAAFCRNCGHELEIEEPWEPIEREVKKRSCPACHKPCASEFSFCPHCGETLQSIENQ